MICHRRDRWNSWPPLFGAMRFRFGLCLLMIFLTVIVQSASADVIKLNGGGEIRGVVRPPDAKTRREQGESADIVIETLAGAELVVPANQILFVTKRPRVIEEYESQAKHVENSVDARWQLSEWCRQHGLVEPRKEQLQLVLELDPEHKPARYGLGHRLQGKIWISAEQADAELLASGYVRYKGRVITTIERDQLEAGVARHHEQSEWRPKIKLWLGWLNGRDARKQGDALNKFRDLRDADAIPAIADFMLRDSNLDVRRLAVQTLAQIEGPSPVPPLTRVALADVDHDLRENAYESLAKDQREMATSLIERALKDESNAVVRRAAVLLARLGSRRSIPVLTEALITSHKARVAVQQGIATGFNSDGSTANSGGLPPEIAAAALTGQYPNGINVQQSGPKPSVKWVTILRPTQNIEVLEALRKIAHQDFGYDKRGWRLWWQSQQR